ncbi:hypothetical protein MAR_029987 [Mya arenaria]|uniref:Uncharacterized protein n=1 Tax=Mya arenaria TaxID=6604 RepID=A0ABY7DI35_MYAAR|nr:hypothetical protein MAR_029987 [Mya arenaria]
MARMYESDQRFLFMGIQPSFLLILHNIALMIPVTRAQAVKRVTLDFTSRAIDQGNSKNLLIYVPCSTASAVEDIFATPIICQSSRPNIACGTTRYGHEEGQTQVEDNQNVNLSTSVQFLAKVSSLLLLIIAILTGQRVSTMTEQFFTPGGISVLARRTSIHLSSILRSCLVQYKIRDRYLTVLARRTSIHLSSILRSCLVQYRIQDRSVMVIEAVRSELCTGKTF